MIEIAKGKYFVKDEDWYIKHRFVVSSGIDDFLKPWDAKPPVYSKSWAEQNGIQYSSNEKVYFKEKEILISGAIVAETIDEYWACYDSLLSFFQDGIFDIYVAELKRLFYIKYDSCTFFDRVTRLETETGDLIVCKFTFKFIEPVPGLFQKLAFLTTKNGDYITTKQGNRILITT